MDRTDLVSQRLHNQRLSSPGFKRPVDVVRWLGAVQAQDFNAAKWALALRMHHATDALIEDAYNAGQILRTHLLRPTWHFAAPDDIRWLLQLTAPRVNIRCGSAFRKFELDAAIFKRSNKVLTKALQGGKHLTRPALKTALNQSGIAADDPVRLAHILIRAELDGVICSGRRIGNQLSYALLDERVPATKMFERDEALAKLTRRYFTSHGPASLHDYAWWSGLTAADAKHGIALLDRYLKKELVQEKAYWTSRTRETVEESRHSAHLLPGYDEYFVAYKDRQLAVGADGLTTWGLLGPTIIVDGMAAGSWKVTNNRSRTIQLSPTITLNKPQTLAVSKAVARYAAFLDPVLAPIR